MKWLNNIIQNIEQKGIKLAISTIFFCRALKHCANPIIVYKELKSMVRRYDETFYENVGLAKIVKANGRYFLRLHVPGWPSKAFNRYLENELNGIFRKTEKSLWLQFIVFGITKQCPLRCKHCYEWERLNQPENLTVGELKSIVKKFQERGVGQILLSGGEPMVRIDDILEILRTARTDTDFWLLTSGYNLTYENALKLKEAGLTGVNISLDHWNPQFHNEFRAHESAYDWVVEAAYNIRKVDMLLCFSLCATKEFVSKENLWKYAYRAKELGADFIQILEPRSVGHFKGKDVSLPSFQQKIIEEFHLKINSDPDYKDLPSVLYAGYHQRRVGCFGGGIRFLYVDPDGYLHACPFCQTEVGHCLKNPLDKSISQLQKVGCHKFRTIPHSLQWGNGQK